MRISRRSTTHEFKKTNMATKRDRLGLYDEYKCDCGLRGKAYGIGEYVTIDGRMKRKAERKCPNFEEPNIEGVKVKVTNCTAVGYKFSNLIPNSIHDVVTPPEGYVNGERGYWVMGVDEPVLLLHGEYELLKQEG